MMQPRPSGLLSLAASILLLAPEPALAQAPRAGASGPASLGASESLWRRVGLWDVLHLPGRPDCALRRVYGNGRELRFAPFEDPRYVLLSMADPAWGWSDAGAIYETALAFSPRGRHALQATGFRQGATAGLLWRLNRFPPLDDFTNATRLVIERDNRPVADLDLAGVGPAMQGFVDCMQARLRDPAQPAPRPAPAAPPPLPRETNPLR